VTKTTRHLGLVALFLALATFILAAVVVGAMPATAAADTYGCRGDQACVKIAETTQCDKPCQLACKEYRFDQELCYRTWGPKLQFQREQQKRGIK
jgi:hypothetical protein